MTLRSYWRGLSPRVGSTGTLTLLSFSILSSISLSMLALTVHATPGNPKAKPHDGTTKPSSRLAQANTLGKLRYNRDVRPILADNCFACHGPDSAARKAGLRLDRFADATANQNGLVAITPGKPDKSEVIRRVTGQGPLMPPPEGHKKLTPAQIATLKRWVTEGAQYELHWAYQPPTRPALPKVSAQNAAWVRNPIDRFVLARLEKEGLKPAPEADRRTLIRRLSLDITGLPPTPADVETFVTDKSPNAYEKLVDKLLANPHYGEHRARYWLDAARYGDSNGIHIDNYREIWSYRDWVIKALNKNIPFDQFTIEQLAGDLLPTPTLDQRIATGFNRCNITTSEGGAIDEEYRVLYARDRTETTSFVFLGSTMNCSVCHDHKFDPFTQKDFYSMSALFNNTTQPIMDGNIQNTPPILPVPRDEDRARFEQANQELAEARKNVDARKVAARGEFDKNLATLDAKSLTAGVPTDGLQLQLALNEGAGKAVQANIAGSKTQLTAATDPGWEAGHTDSKAFVRKPGSTFELPASGDFEKDQSFSTSAWVKVPNGNGNGALLARMDDQHDFRGWDLWLQNNRVGTHIINKWPTDALKVVSRGMLQPNKWHHVCVTYSGKATPESVNIYIDGVLQEKDVESNTLKNTIRTQVPLKIGQRHTTSPVDGIAMQDMRIYGRTLSVDEVGKLMRNTRNAWLVSRVASTTAPLNAAEKDELFTNWLNNADPAYRDLVAKVNGLDGEIKAIRARGTEAHVMQEKSEEAMAFILARGEYDKRKEKVTPATPAVLPGMPTDYPKNRLGFAKWLLRPENPLTARVTVNRYWQEIFGQGIVRTTGDFGVNGELPSNQELLDWLAVDFREGNWDIKRFFKQIVMSATYRQSATVTPEKLQRDPKNILFSRGPRFRMDAEMVRDYALAASGLMAQKIGGPSVKPYQPDGIWEAVTMPGSNTYSYKRDTGEALYRRSLYTFWKRSAPPASLEIFNAPTREYCTVRRERTNTPLQALVTLNDEQYVEAARHLAQLALLSGKATDAAKIDFMTERLLARAFRPEERTVALKSLADLKAFYANPANLKEATALIAVGESKADASLKPETLAAWTMLANQLMNLDEVLNK